jgi:hypothetical protein
MRGETRSVVARERGDEEERAKSRDIKRVPGWREEDVRSVEKSAAGGAVIALACNSGKSGPRQHTTRG